jgi:hypothetical protein
MLIAPPACLENKPSKKKDKTAHPMKMPGSEGFSSKVFFKEINQCAMGGCELFAEIKGYCPSCYALRRYYAAQGKPILDSISPLQIKHRRGLC